MIKVQNLADFAKTYEPFGFRETAFVPSYGMAETTLSLAFTPPGRGCKSVRLDLNALEMRGQAKPATETTERSRAFAFNGPPLLGHDIEIRDQRGRSLPDGEVGTIFARGPSIMTGYFDNPEATAKALSPDGWLDTGDLGCMIDGEIVITGRSKDLIIVNGRNIWPQDIEWTVEHTIDGIREGGVVAFGGINGEPDASEETITIVIECRTTEPDGREALRVDADALVREVHGVAPRVALSKPGSLPRTSSGKLSRAKARDMYLAGSFDV